MKKDKDKNNIYVVGKTLSSGVTRPAKPATPIYRSARPVVQQPAIKKRRRKRWLLLILLLPFILLLVIGIWDARNYSKASQKLFGTSNLLAGLSTSPLQGSERGRVNLMVVGYSADDPGHDGANLTDSIMIVSLSTKGKASYMLSVPRDLYVHIQDYGRAKINEAYQAGEISNFSEAGYPTGGMGLLEKTIARTLGVQVDYYALVNYTAVRATTDALDGITVDIQSSDPRGIHDPNFPPEQGGPLTLPNGPQKIDGQTALRLTRARGAAGNSYGLAQSDFDRTKNQQAVMLGIKSKVNWQLLLNPLRNEELLDGIASNVRTDIEINEALPFYRLFNSIPSAELKPISLRDFNKQNLLSGYTTPYGQSALIPAAGITDFSEIQAAINSLN